jgi:hypothetical protein
MNTVITRQAMQVAVQCMCARRACRAGVCCPAAREETRRTARLTPRAAPLAPGTLGVLCPSCAGPALLPIASCRHIYHHQCVLLQGPRDSAGACHHAGTPLGVRGSPLKAVLAFVNAAVVACMSSSACEHAPSQQRLAHFHALSLFLVFISMRCRSSSCLLLSDDCMRLFSSFFP